MATLARPAALGFLIVIVLLSLMDSFMIWPS
jgi:hypothetical protein